MPDTPVRSRRLFLKHVAVAGGAALTGLPGILRAQQAPAILAADSARPLALHGLQLGDVLADSAIVWSRADREARMFVEWSLHENFAKAVTLRGPHAIGVSDFSARSEPVVGRFRTAPRKHRDIRFLWAGDTAGQGWGINPDFGGMRTYE